MRPLLALLALATVAVGAEQPAPAQLDPRKPEDAIVIIDRLTAQATMTREQAVALTVALETLRQAIQPKPVTPAPSPERKP